MVALRSTDGGATFTRVVVSDLQAADNDPMRAISLPSLDVDSNGTIYAVWHDCRFRAGVRTERHGALDVARTALTWSAPARIPLAPASSVQSFFIPGLAADPAQPGRLGLVYAYYHAGSCRGSTRQGVPARHRVRAVARRRQDVVDAAALDAQPFSTNWVPRAEGGRMVGDYFSVSFAGDRVVPVFALATSPLKGRFRQGIFAASLRALG